MIRHFSAGDINVDTGGEFNVWRSLPANPMFRVRNAPCSGPLRGLNSPPVGFAPDKIIAESFIFHNSIGTSRAIY
jgi:hypothetical protein